MGRLFWKFFFFIWLAQLAGVLGTGIVFWLDRQALEQRFESRPPPGFRPPAAYGVLPPPPPRGGLHQPPLPRIAGGLLASLLCAAGLAWYVAKPIRQLRGAFEAAAEGNLEVKIGERMGKRRDELADLGHDFDRMTEHLRALMDGQRRLLHDVSHELRSPLARLQAAIGLARQQPARLEDSLQRIEREGERMNRLVGELLTLSRLEAGVEVPLEGVDVGELLADLVADARFEAAGKQVTVNCQNSPNFIVRANGELLHRAIENVVRNALRYSPLGGVVDIKLSRRDAARCQIEIVDQGPGVPGSELESIFAPFFRVVGQGDGYGLGLAIARRVLAAIDGTIHAENGVDRGLRVVLELPLVV
ncbi:MAG: ATP-binding protein [Rhodocyclaceae bacterium]|nr:ATP-binding protein [Rhodocyclaceae bacterium]